MARRARDALGDRLSAPLDWEEDPAGTYFTDKPDWDPHTAVVLLAAHEEFPDVPLPASIAPREDTSRLPLMQRLRDAHPDRPLSLKERLRGRTAPPRTEWRYAQVQFPELWLPSGIRPVMTPMVGRQGTVARSAES